MKHSFQLFTLGLLAAALCACNDYQNDIDQLGSIIDSLEAANQGTLAQIKSIVIVPDFNYGQIVVDGTQPTTVRYHVEPKHLASIVAADWKNLSFVAKQEETQTTDVSLRVEGATADNATGYLTVTATPAGVFDGAQRYSLALLYTDGHSSIGSAYAPVYVTTRPTALAISLRVDEQLLAGAIYQLVAHFTPAYTTEREVVWSVDDTSKATVDQDGVLRPIDNGTITITVTSVPCPSVSASAKATIRGGKLTLNDDSVSQGDAE